MSPRNRREFLEDSMIAAAAAVAVGPGGELLADHGTGDSSPNARFGVAIVGARGRGGTHIGAFAGRRDTEILYVSDVDIMVGNRRVNEVEKRQGRRPKFVEDMRQALEDPRVDIVTIATPNHLHALQAIWSIRAGKDVFLEKPASHNVTEGRRIVEAARKYNRICQVGMQCRSNPGMIDAINYVHAGELGHIEVARGLCYKRRSPIGEPTLGSPPTHVNYDLWLGPAPLAPVTRAQFHHDWHWQWQYGNGDLGNQGVHQLDIARWGLGATQLSKRVLSYGGRFHAGDVGETANTQVVIYDYGASALVFEVRGLPTPAYRRAKVGVIFEGSAGYLVMHGYDKGAAFDSDGNKVKEFKGSGDHFANFLKAVRCRDHTVLNADIEEGHLSSALCHLGNISYRLGVPTTIADLRQQLATFGSAENGPQTLRRTLSHLRANKVDMRANRLCAGRPLDLDQAAETVLNDAAASEMLTRSDRPPFVVPTAHDV